MTLLNQTRWECDYCHAVSPVLETDHPGAGWLYYDCNEQPDIPKLAALPSLGSPFGPPMLHFCCVAHCERFVEEANGDGPRK